ncbi:hypothetical protein FRB94_001224 [Tulasnella sp. JGI-2019a]|nr:hypothetical protein FRB94_001224 [Tulasnella sp. JGI-2019a]
MVDAIPLDVAHLMGFLVSMSLYGTIRQQWANRSKSPVIAWVTVTMFPITTAATILSAVDAVTGWVGKWPAVADYFLLAWTPIRPVETLLSALAAVVYDIFQCWRLYVVWGKKRPIVIVPAGLLVLESTCIIIICILSFNFRTVSNGDIVVNTHGSLLAVKYVAGVSVAIINVMCTSLIIFRLCSPSQSEGPAQSLQKTVIGALIESGALGTLVLLLWLLFSLIPGPNGAQIFLTYVVIMIMPIAAMLIVIHLTAHLRNETETFSMGRINNNSTRKNRMSRNNFLSSKTSRVDPTKSGGSVLVNVQHETYRSSTTGPSMSNDPQYHGKLKTLAGLRETGSDLMPPARVRLQSGDEEYQGRTNGQHIHVVKVDPKHASDDMGKGYYEDEFEESPEPSLRRLPVPMDVSVASGGLQSRIGLTTTNEEEFDYEMTEAQVIPEGKAFSLRSIVYNFGVLRGKSFLYILPS